MPKDSTGKTASNIIEVRPCRGIAQLVEHRSPKPRVEGSSPSAPASFKTIKTRPQTTYAMSVPFALSAASSVRPFIN